MKSPEFNNFRLVGGTALSLLRGHRQSVDIDLFSDANYGTIDFETIDSFLKAGYSYYDSPDYGGIIGMGKSYFIGTNSNNCIKLDLFYTDQFIEAFQMVDGIRIASVEEIIAMKLDVIMRGGRKKDFWDIHELIDDYSFPQMLSVHQKRYPYTHDSQLIKANFTNFNNADNDFDPICLKAKYWEIIKLDLIDFIQ